MENPEDEFDLDISFLDEIDLDFDLDSKSDTEIQDGVAVSANVAVQSVAEKKYLKNLELGFKMAKSIDDLCDRPKANEQWLIVTEKQFNAFALVLSIIQEKVIDELYFAIYRINEPTVDALISFIEAGKIKKGLFIISNFFNATKKPEKWANKLIEFCSNRSDFECISIHNHAKILCLKEGDNHFVFEGSGNMSDNARIEQYRYENCVQTFEFHKNWMIKLKT